VRDFPALYRRLRWLQSELSAVERTLEAEAFQGISPKVYLHQQLSQEQSELDFILRYYQRQTNGALGKMQWLFVAASVVVSLILLLLLLAQRGVL
jgi:hypothetical protein